MKNPVKLFIDELSKVKSGKEFYNHYSMDYNLVNGSVCQNNLLCYLITMQKEIKPKTILLGEAPGYKGCTLTGVPFTSEAIIGSGKIKLFNYSAETNTNLHKDKNNLQSESTATMFWDVLKQLDIYPLLWNSFPFSPYDPATNSPNRAPSISEIEMYGKKYFLKLIELIPVKNFVAVGRVAENALRIFGINNFEYVPHPSFGNKKKFFEGLNLLKKKNYF